MSQWTDDLFYVFVYFQESQIKRIFGTMINQKLQDFEEDVKPLGDLMTQVNFHAYLTRCRSCAVWIYVTEQVPPLPLPGTTATDSKCFEKANLCEMARVHDNTTLVRFGKAP